MNKTAGLRTLYFVFVFLILVLLVFVIDIMYNFENHKTREYVKYPDIMFTIQKGNNTMRQDMFTANKVNPFQAGKVFALHDISGDTSINCSERKVTLSKTVLPVTALASFPGSGNTWVRHLIQQMTGLATSSIYCDARLRRQGFPFECEEKKERTIVVKTHNLRRLPRLGCCRGIYFIQIFPIAQKVVFLIRNPFDAFLSFANLISTKNHVASTSKAKLKQVMTSGFKCFHSQYSKLINSTINEFIGPVHVLQYEKMKTNMAQELRSLATFLNVSVTDKDIECTKYTQEGNFQRKVNQSRHSELLQTVYNKSQMSKLRELATVSQKRLKRAFNVDVDLRSPLEKAHFKTS